MTKKYQRDIKALRAAAVLHWPPELLDEAAKVSALPTLLKTQDSFLSILKIADATPEAWKSALQTSRTITPTLFLKHLMVLSDLGGEALNKLPPVGRYFEGDVLKFSFAGSHARYRFQRIHEQVALTNAALGVGSTEMLSPRPLSPLAEDVCMMLLYASQSTNADEFPAEAREKCIIGSLLGKTDELEQFCRSNYLRVSRQVGGASANALGQVTQTYVAEVLRRKLPAGWMVTTNGSIPGVSVNGTSATTFDVVAVSRTRRYFGVEVSFQVTTNSTIERKAREAGGLQRAVHARGGRICYVIDGAGNINVREQAVSTLCQHSDCTVSFSDVELDVLVEFLTAEGRYS